MAEVSAPWRGGTDLWREGHALGGSERRTRDRGGGPTKDPYRDGGAAETSSPRAGLEAETRTGEEAGRRNRDRGGGPKLCLNEGPNT